MVTLYVGNKPVGTLADAERLIPELIARKEVAELRDDAGRAIGTFEPINPDEPPIPWSPHVTWEELERRSKEPGIPFEEVKKRLGWE